ncbi:DODA-type extradiol aromatic ring-opening family dioxygenase [Bordetella genomosp. 9]|uniref:Dioxygenase n=1 Tax=Bordetella genomosp. 9 TaxID=1416803 RepID=A0A1W6YXQ7_9BORD|nr:class III extradiol ring-cleavage dioxygenase [Bordetella genomosp. 9]ARP85393.1 dioxygenase [Bordetella genomosp. 9]ARP89375.1 dioxygenase [Bordetella genomosp. 9]
MNTSPPAGRMPVYFLSHGGGPWPYMEGPMRRHFQLLEQSLQDIPRQLPGRPKAVLVVSGHWEAPAFTVSASPQPGMVFDYYGFPDYTYRISYPAPGSPALAERARRLLTDAGWDAQSDPDRGFDHGTFSMLKPIYPDADMPVVQLSMKADMDPAEHIAAGEALAPLRDEGVLILGSGLSYHNLRQWGPAAKAPSEAFDGWLRQVLLDSGPQARRDALLHWESAPAARQAHPREDHLIPLMVAVGAAGSDPATCVYGESFMGAIAAASYRFGHDRTPTAFDVRGQALAA